MTFAASRVEDMQPIRWLGALAEAIAQTIGTAQDEEVDTLKASASFGAPAYCPDDAIPRLADIFRMPTFAGYTPAKLRELCRQAFPIWEEIGLPQAIVRALQTFGIPTVQVFNYSDWPTADEWFSKFYVAIGGLFGPLNWGAFNWGDASWGSTATVVERRIVQRLIVFCKSPQSLPVGVIVDLGGGMIWGLHEWNSEVWGGEAIFWPLANLWGADWVHWGGVLWGTGRWITGEL